MSLVFAAVAIANVLVLVLSRDASGGVQAGAVFFLLAGLAGVGALVTGVYAFINEERAGLPVFALLTAASSA